MRPGKHSGRPPSKAETWDQDTLIEPEDDGRGDADGRHECMRAAVVSGCDAQPVL